MKKEEVPVVSGEGENVKVGKRRVEMKKEESPSKKVEEPVVEEVKQ